MKKITPIALSAFTLLAATSSFASTDWAPAKFTCTMFLDGVPQAAGVQLDGKLEKFTEDGIEKVSSTMSYKIVFVPGHSMVMFARGVVAYDEDPAKRIPTYSTWISNGNLKALHEGKGSSQWTNSDSTLRLSEKSPEGRDIVRRMFCGFRN